MSQVADLLAQSRAAHEAYRQALPRLDPQTKQIIPGDSEAAATHLQRAYDLRAQAEALDVAGEASVWTDDGQTYPHYALLAFYDVAERKFKEETTAILVQPPKVRTRG